MQRIQQLKQHVNATMRTTTMQSLELVVSEIKILLNKLTCLISHIL